jgi:hypothetical protein
MKETFQKKLNTVKSLEERTALKELIEKVLLPMAEYQEGRWDAIRARVFDESRPKSGFFPIITGLCAKSEYDPAHTWLFPILPPDAPDLSAVSAALSEEKPVELFSVYLDEPWERFREILTGERLFEAVLHTEKSEVRASCKLYPDKRFSEALKGLYASFVLHGIPWKTVQSAYINRMARVVLTSAEKLPEDETLTEINVKFEDTAVKHDMLPLWNIETLLLKGTGFAIPFEENALFEHRIRFSNTDESANFLVAPDPLIRSVKREGAESVLLSEAPKNREWNVYKVVSPQSSVMDKEPSFPLFSNAGTENFTAFVADGTRVFTAAEIMRRIESHGLPLTAGDIQITDEKYPDEIPGTMNFELDEAFSQINDTKTLRVFFSVEDMGEYAPYAKDMIAFLMSELQIVFQKYRCTGVLT